MRYLSILTAVVAFGLWNGLLAQQPPGNTPNNPIQLTLTRSGSGVWTATAQANNESANGYTNDYQGNAYPRGTPGNDVFFTLTLPTCFDSMRVRTCGSNFDTYLHIINTSLPQPDTAVNDDNRATCATYNSSGVSSILIISRPNANLISRNSAGLTSFSQQDSILLRGGDQLLIIVEGFTSGHEGDIELEVLAYELGPDPVFTSFTTCPINNVTLSLDNAADMPPGTSYNWTFSGAYSGTSTDAQPVIDLSTATGTVNVQVVVTLPAPSWDPNCVTRDTAYGTITVVSPPPPYAGGQIRCPACANPVLIGTSFTIRKDATTPPRGPNLQLIVSTDSGATWSVVASNPTFPYTVNVPQDIAEVGTRWYRVVAYPLRGCPGSPDSSNVITVVVTDRPGNRLANAIPVSLTYNSTTQRWEAVVRDSTNGPGTTNEYGPPTFVGPSSNPRGTDAQDLFFLIRLPACMDSMRFNTCAGTTFYDTWLNLINLTLPDTTANDDQGALACPSMPSGFVSPGYTSRIDVIAAASSAPIIRTVPSASSARPTRDTMRLAAGDLLLVIVEGYSSGSEGRFTLEVTGWGALPRPAPNLGPDQTVCVSVSTLTLDATTAGANSYEWVVNGSVVPGANNATYTLPLVPGTHEVIARATFSNTQGLTNGPICTTAHTADTVLITVSPEPDASIAVGSTTYNSGQTYSLYDMGSSVTETFIASSTVSGNSYQWELYNPNSTAPDATGTGGTFTHTFTASGAYTLILLSTNGACGPERDTLFVNVNLLMGLSGGSGSFAVFPNPNTGAFTVVAPAPGSYDLRILDVAGKLVYADRMEGERKDLRLNLPAGTYQLVLSDGGRTGTARLFVVD